MRANKKKPENPVQKTVEKFWEPFPPTNSRKLPRNNKK